jgi:alpha-1,2-mannosyltransferase
MRRIVALHAVGQRTDLPDEVLVSAVSAGLPGAVDYAAEAAGIDHGAEGTPAMRADVGLASRRAAGGRDAVQAGGRALLIVGAAVAAVAAVAYLAALATHPMNAMLKGFDLQVYLGGAREALHHSHSLYTWVFEHHPGIQFTYTPFAALAFAAGLALPFKALMAVVTVVSLFSLVATIWIAFRQLGWEKTSRLGATLLLSGLLLWTEPVQRALYLGQVELVLMALVVWDLCQPDRRPWKGAVTGIAAGIKLVPLLFIAYLLLTRRFKQAAVAAGAFLVTVIIGFIALPYASVYWWIDGNFFQAGRTGFVGSEQNQALRGIMTRLIGSVNGAATPWLLVAVIVGLAGLAAAVVLDQRGYTFAGLMAAALTALLVSPISWDHHWVWIAPGLALIVDAAVRAGRAGAAGLRTAWYALAAVVLILFASWPDFWSAKAGLLQGGLINYAPAASFANGDNPRYPEYHWHGLQLIAGNLELLVGLGLFVVVLAVAFRLLRSARPAAR